MKIALLSKTICIPTIAVIEYFIKNNVSIDCVIIEKNFRKKFSESEIKFRKAHDKFNKYTKKYSFIRRIAKSLWDKLPFMIKKYIFVNIYDLPLLNKFSVKKHCEKLGIKVYEVNRHSSEGTKDIFIKRHTDYALMISSHWLLKDPIITMQKTKIINAHSGLLPKHKGLDSIAWSIKENDPVGLTTHFIDNGIDSGDVLKFYEVKVEKGNNLNHIYNKVGNIQPGAFLDTLVRLEEKEITPIKQDEKYKPHIPMSYDELIEINKKLIDRK